MAKRRRGRSASAEAADPDQDVVEKLEAVDSWLETPMEGRYRDLVEAMLLAEKHGKREEDDAGEDA